MDLLNIVTLYNPMRIFLPISAFCFLVGFGWGIPIVLKGDGVSVGAMLGIVTGVIIFFMGLIAEQLASIKRERLDADN